MKPYLNPIQETLDKYNDIFNDVKKDNLESAINKLGPTVKNGMIETGLVARNGRIGTKVIVKTEYKVKRNGQTITEKLEVTVETYVNPLNVAPIPVVDYVRVADSIKNNNMQAGYVAISALVVIGGIALLPEAVVGAAAVAAATVFLSVITWGKELIS
ncbi:hypothetical protein [Carnobacterium divergens]|uniref:hypothetical protein n=1 Tax=Carnobacterium divergens TaxID=2748 RepID=UPI001EE2DCC1|nr:hypothetical protein [Carnobacterium divergens]